MDTRPPTAKLVIHHPDLRDKLTELIQWARLAPSNLTQWDRTFLNSMLRILRGKQIRLSGSQMDQVTRLREKLRPPEPGYNTNPDASDHAARIDAWQDDSMA